MNKAVFMVFIFPVLGCVSITETSVSEMSNQGLCDLVNPNMYLSTFEERERVYKELESRNLVCQ
jgi:hypothetical protein